MAYRDRKSLTEQAAQTISRREAGFVDLERHCDEPDGLSYGLPTHLPQYSPLVTPEDPIYQRQDSEEQFVGYPLSARRDFLCRHCSESHHGRLWLNAT